MHMSEVHYHYEKEGVAAGPAPSSELAQHGVTRDTLVWAEGMNAWLAAGQVEALAPLFVKMPPPLPTRNMPPPLPIHSAPVHEIRIAAAPVTTVSAPIISPFTPDGYSLPLLGKFEGDEDIWVMDSESKLGSFDQNADLKRLQEGTFQSLKQYRFLLLDPDGEKLLTLYKPKAPLFNPFEKGELHVLDGTDQRIGVCHRSQSFNFKGIIDVEDARGRHLMKLDKAAFGSRDFVLETPNGIIGRIRRTKTADWTQMLLESKNDRLELIFEPDTKDRHKALGISAVLAVYLFVPQF